jgi:putative DNA primase/helicase
MSELPVQPNASALIEALGGNHHTGMYCCPAHEDSTPSLKVSQASEGKVLVKCFAGCTQIAVIEALRQRGLWPDPKQLGYLPLRRVKLANASRCVASADDGEAEYERQSKGWRILRAAAIAKKQNAGSVAPYLNRRGIKAVPECALWLPAKVVQRHIGKRFPAMVVPVIRDSLLQGAQVTLLDADGRGKLSVDAPRLSFGKLRGGHVPIGQSDPNRPLIVAEGVETAMAASQITGMPAIATLGAQNLRTVEPPPCSEIIITADNDDTGRDAAEALARRLCGRKVRIAVPDGPKGYDWNDVLHSGADTEELRRSILEAECFEAKPYRESQSSDKPPSRNEVEQRLDDLAKLDKIDYEMARKDAAKELAMRPSVLDDAVASRREMPTSALDFMAPVEPWSEPVDGAALVGELKDTLERHIVLPKGAALATALWIVHAHAHDAATHSPILFINSPTKRCGKTQLLVLIGKLVPKPLSAANVTPAVVFRAIDRWHPTLLIDEADTFISEKSELRGVLNSGHTPAQSFVLRCVGDDFEPKQFSTWAPKAFANIGRMHPTLEDRSIAVPLKRKMKGEHVERLPFGADAFLPLARRCARWAQDHLAALREASPLLPDLHDRAKDNWTPLLAIAEAAGEDWAEKARAAATRLSGLDDDETPAIMLLEDIARLFELGKGANMFSREIIEDLQVMEERPWPEFNKGKPINQRGLAQLLKPFGIEPTTVARPGWDGRAKGYKLSMFRQVFKRYLSQEE